MNKKLTIILSLIAVALIGSEVSARRGYRSYSPRSYSKKAPLSGLGKPSKFNGMLKCKITGGHSKRTSKGLTYVNPYARGK